MLILALDTSGKSLSAALTQNGEIIGESTLSLGMRHSATALPLIHDICNRCGIAYPAIDAFACAVGPGSYTGIRIGVSMIKGMAYAGNRPAVGISSLEALSAALDCVDDFIIVPIIDARSGRVFCSARYLDRMLIPEGNHQQFELADQLAIIMQSFPMGNRKILLTGDGAADYANLASWPSADLVRDAGPDFRWPRAAVIAKLAGAALQTGADFSPFRLEAAYISLSQAERLGQSHD